MRLSALSEIKSGYTPRGRLEAVNEGGVPAVQLRDLRGEEDFDPTKAMLYQLAPSFERYWAASGDILFRSRGERNTAVAIAPGSESAVVVILPLLIIRPNPEVVDPRYLAWFINQPSTQRHFDKYARGTHLRMIPKSCLDDLEVPLPSLERQRLITEVDDCARRESALTHLLADKRRELATLLVLHEIGGEIPPDVKSAASKIKAHTPAQNRGN